MSPAHEPTNPTLGILAAQLEAARLVNAQNERERARGSRLECEQVQTDSKIDKLEEHLLALRRHRFEVAEQIRDHQDIMTGLRDQDESAIRKMWNVLQQATTGDPASVNGGDKT